MDFQLPELGEGVYEAELVDWLVAPGDTVAPGQSLAEVMTDKATMELPAPFAGKIMELRFEPGDQLNVGDHILSYESDNAAEQDNGQHARHDTGLEVGHEVSHEQKNAGSSRPTATTTQAAPSVRRMAREMGVDLSRVQGSGPHGRILLDDLSAHRSVAERDTTSPRTESQPQPGSRIKLRGVRRAISQLMVASKRTIPHYSYVDECNVTDLVRLRESLNASSDSPGFKLTYLPFVVKAVVRALKEVPLINASLDDEAEEIVLHDRYEIGIATATPSGLIVPVLRDANRLDVFQIAREIKRLATQARDRTLAPDDLQGATFTVTSVGSIGGLISTPIIPHPQVGIVGIGKIVKRPVFDEHDNIQPAQMMYLSFSFDHRVVDGAMGAAFSNRIIQQLQEPAKLLIGDSN